MNRKDAHLKLSLEQIKKKNSFDEYRLEYFSIPNFNIDDICIKTKIANISLDAPIYINAITAGSSKADKINKDLEEVAKKTNLFFFPGSYSPILKNPSFYYPKNMGLNLGIDKDYNLHLQAIKNTNAKILQVHTNMIQEIIMKEGDKNFENWEGNLKNILKFSNIPIILKETGFGMNEQTIQKAINLGVKIFDISGNDGTNFAKIENSRLKNPKIFYEEIGYSTTESIINATKFENIEILASGGIRNPLDVVKALALGANAVGISNTFLNILENEGKEKLIDTIQEWKKDIKYLLLITNSRNIKELKGKIRKQI